MNTLNDDWHRFHESLSARPRSFIENLAFKSTERVCQMAFHYGALCALGLVIDDLKEFKVEMPRAFRDRITRRIENATREAERH